MFEGIQRNLSEALKRLRGRGRITEANIREAMQEVRKALLDADVNYTVANDFVQRVTERSIGQEVLRTLDPSEQIFKIVYDELVALMGPVDTSFHFAKDRPTVLMLCGLQGQGKTTTAGKLALTLRERGRKPMLVAGASRSIPTESCAEFWTQLGNDRNIDNRMISFSPTKREAQLTGATCCVVT